MKMFAFVLFFLLPQVYAESVFDEFEDKHPIYDHATEYMQRQRRDIRKPDLIFNNEAQTIQTLRVFLPKHTPILISDKDEIIKSPKDLFVKISSPIDSFGYYHILDKNKKVTNYKVHWKKIVLINDITQMDVMPTSFKSVEKSIKNQGPAELQTNKFIKVLAGQSPTQFSKRVTEKKYLTTNIFAIEGNIYAKWDFPLLVGANLHYENSSASFDEGSIQNKTLSLGPSVRYQFTDSKWSIEGHLRWSVYSILALSTPNNDDSLNITKNIYAVGVNKKSMLFDIPMEWGLSIAREWIELNSNLNNVSLYPNNNYNDAIYASIAYGF